MSIDMNIVIFAGRLTKDPEPFTGGGCRFDVASNRRFTSKGKKREQPTYMTVIAWGALAETILRQSQKGDQVIVDGRLDVRKVVREDEKTRVYTSIIAEDVRFVDYRKTTEVVQREIDEELESLDELGPSAKDKLKAFLTKEN